MRWEIQLGSSATFLEQFLTVVVAPALRRRHEAAVARKPATGVYGASIESAMCQGQRSFGRIEAKTLPMDFARAQRIQK